MAMDLAGSLGSPPQKATFAQREAITQEALKLKVKCITETIKRANKQKNGNAR